MRIQMAMVPWNKMLLILDAVHLSLNEHEEPFRATITEAEFDELYQGSIAPDHVNGARLAVLRSKIFSKTVLRSEPCFEKGNHTDGWCISYDYELFLEHDRREGTLEIRSKDLEEPTLLLLLQHLPLFLPANTPVIHSLLGQARDFCLHKGEIVESVTFEESEIEQKGFLLPFVMETCALLMEACADELGLPPNWRNREPADQNIAVS